MCKPNWINWESRSFSTKIWIVFRIHVMFDYLNIHIEFLILRFLLKIHVISIDSPLLPRLPKTANPSKAFFHWNPELLGLGRQIGQINSGPFGVFWAELSAPILVQWVPGPCFQLINQYFYKKLSLYIQIKE